MDESQDIGTYRKIMQQNNVLLDATINSSSLLIRLTVFESSNNKTVYTGEIKNLDEYEKLKDFCHTLEDVFNCLEEQKNIKLNMVDMSITLNSTFGNGRAVTEIAKIYLKKKEGLEMKELDSDINKCSSKQPLDNDEVKNILQRVAKWIIKLQTNKSNKKQTQTQNFQKEYQISDLRKRFEENFKQIQKNSQDIGKLEKQIGELIGAMKHFLDLIEINQQSNKVQQVINEIRWIKTSINQLQNQNQNQNQSNNTQCQNDQSEQIETLVKQNKIINGIFIGIFFAIILMITASLAYEKVIMMTAKFQNIIESAKVITDKYNKTVQLFQLLKNESQSITNHTSELNNNFNNTIISIESRSNQSFHNTSNLNDKFNQTIIQYEIFTNKTKNLTNEALIITDKFNKTVTSFEFLTNKTSNLTNETQILNDKFNKTINQFEARANESIQNTSKLNDKFNEVIIYFELLTNKTRNITNEYQIIIDQIKKIVTFFEHLTNKIQDLIQKTLNLIEKFNKIVALFEARTNESIENTSKLNDKFNETIISFEKMTNITLNNSQTLINLQNDMKYLESYIMIQKQKRQKSANNFTFDGKTLTKISDYNDGVDNWQKYFFFQSIPYDKQFCFKIKILKTKMGNLIIGVVDEQKKIEQIGKISKDSVGYILWSQKKYPSLVKEGNGAIEGDTVVVKVNRQNSAVRWIVNQKQQAEQINSILIDQNKKFITYIEMANAGDTIEYSLCDN